MTQSVYKMDTTVQIHTDGDQLMWIFFNSMSMFARCIVGYVYRYDLVLVVFLAIVTISYELVTTFVTYSTFKCLSSVYILMDLHM